MLYGCVFCNRVWCSHEKYETLDKENLDIDNRQDISHGICPECFQKQKYRLVHRHQKYNGYDECYNRNEGCQNNFCMFKPTCGQQAINEWQENIIMLGVQAVG